MISDNQNTVILNRVVISDKAKESIAHIAEFMAISIRQLVDRREWIETLPTVQARTS